MTVSSDDATMLARAPHRIGRVVLVVRDLDRVAGFYLDAIGLDLLHRDAASADLGTGENVLLTLRADPGARRSAPREAGLFHTAFLLPSRIDLGAWLRHAADRGLRLDGAADHLVSEAIYLSDPEGNGIEIYADRPDAVWPRTPTGVAMANAPLDRPALMALAGAPWRGLPAGASVGHVHLRVGALEPADRFYAGLLGFDVTCRFPGASFYGSGGYHHQLAANIWHSEGARPADGPRTGLAAVEFRFAADALDAARRRFGEAGVGVETGAAGGLSVTEPWGVALRLLPA
ncbi:VOC family protein [Methylobacterium oryzihabitans]|uniref:VOC family protein n=1 Tax=Methylobacterium oryzihabitans TaxID=2499852 RepID=A0A437PC63_9HYPH|nr:VOC family protein [Methylobacterium oryzihabitans]RVU19805.1 VOC family protein [Methylobacterium oryzihabitans]